MIFPVRRFKIVYGHSRVDLSRFQRLVAQQLLNVPDRGAVLHHVGGAGVPKGVRADVLFDSGTGRMAFYHRPDAVGVHPVAESVDDQIPAIIYLRLLTRRKKNFFCLKDISII